MYKALRRRLGRIKRSLSLLKSKRKVKRSIGAELYDGINDLRIVSFPNYLEPSESVGSYGYSMQKILACLSITPKPFDPMTISDLIIDWQDLTESQIETTSYAGKSLSYFGHPTPAVVNGRCRDISKRAIADAFQTAFGYDLDLDPTKHCGAAVMKSNSNFAHDGQIIQCPIASEDVQHDRVYSRLVDNIQNGFAVDLRLIYIRRVLPYFYRKERSEKERFSNTNIRIEIAKTAEHFSAEEIRMVGTFCDILGADYGEMDTLRDQKTGKLYIVDFAKTPFGELNGLRNDDKCQAMEEMSVAFAQNILAPIVSEIKQNAP